MGIAVSCGVGRRCGSDPELLWLWRRPVATAMIRPLAWEPTYAAGGDQEIATTTTKKTKKKKKRLKETRIKKMKKKKKKRKGKVDSDIKSETKFKREGC